MIFQVRNSIGKESLAPKSFFTTSVSRNIAKLFFCCLKFQDIYQSSEIMSIKIGNNTKRAVFYGGEKNLTRDEDLAIQVGFKFSSWCDILSLYHSIFLFMYPLIMVSFYHSNISLSHHFVMVDHFIVASFYNGIISSSYHFVVAYHFIIL